ncbi:MAG: hypothetical protein QXP32_03540 [Nitrososphaeria archaeon]
MKYFGNFTQSFLNLRQIGISILVGTLLRISLAIYACHFGDIQVFYIAATNIACNIGIYDTFYYTYPPLFPIIFSPFFLIYKIFFSWYSLGVFQLSDPNLPLFISSPIFNILLKTPIFIFDLLTGLVIYRFLCDINNKNLAEKAFNLWYFNPLLIFISSINGQFDIIPTFFLVLSFIELLNNKYIISGLSLGLGIMAKLFPIYFLPLYLVIIIYNNGLKNFKKILLPIYFFIIGLFFSIFIIFSPFFLTNTCQNLLHSILARTTYISSLGGLNFFNIIYLPYFEFLINLFNNFSFIVNIALNIILLIYILIVIFKTLKKGFSIKNIINAHIKILTVIYLTLLTTNPQYIIWILPFLTLWCVLFNEGLLRIYILSICGIMFSLPWSFPFYQLYYFSIFNNYNDLKLIIEFYYSITKNFIMISGVLGCTILLSFLFLRGCKN